MHEPEVAVVGSANLDMVVRVARVPIAGETVLGGDLRQIPGGKGANQAVGAARLGRAVAFVGRIGSDDAGSVLKAALDDSGVDTRWLAETPGVASGVALIAVNDEGDNAIVVSPGANARLTPADINTADALQQAAVTLIQLEIPLETVEAAAKAATGIVILNPAPAALLSPATLAAVDILVPNQTELATLAGLDVVVNSTNAAQIGRSLGIDRLVVTLGAEGCLVIDGDHPPVHIPAPFVQPVDTTAAGDSFCGALADGLARGNDLVSSAAWAVRVGAATTLVAGAQPSLPTADEVDERLGGQLS